MKKLFVFIILFICLENIKASDTLDIKKWKECSIKEANLKFYYPDFILKLDTANNQLWLSHGVQYRHPDPCNLRDSIVDSLNFLSDLSFSIQFVKENITEFIIKIGGDFVKTNYVINDTIKPEKGFIDKINIGKLKGYIFQEGLEGCGRNMFILSVTDNSILLIILPYAWDNVIGYDNLDTIYYPEVKGLMTPIQATKLFYKILETIQ